MGAHRPVLLGMADGGLTANGMQRLPATAGIPMVAATLAVGLQVCAPALCKMTQS